MAPSTVEPAIDPIAQPIIEREPTTAGLARGLDRLVLAQESDHGHGRGITLADLGQLVDAGVAARTVP